MTYNQLTEIERYQIFSLKEAGFTQRFIATSLHRAPSTISRELKRKIKAQKYYPKQAPLKTSGHRYAAVKSVKPKIVTLIKQLACQDLIPKQTVSYLKRENKKTELVLRIARNALIKSNALVIGKTILS